MKNLSQDGKKIIDYFNKSIFKSRISDAEYDTLVSKSLNGLYDISLTKVNLHRRDCIARPVMIIGPPNFNKLGGLEFMVQKRKDNYIRFIPFGITIYNFTDHSLVAYQCNYDPSTNNALSEGTFEYFYNDIVSFETVTESGSEIDYDWKDKIIKAIPILSSIISTGEIVQYDSAQKFILTTSGGTQLPVTLTESILKEATNGGNFSLTASYKSISAIRRIIRGKKSYTH